MLSANEASRLDRLALGAAGAPTAATASGLRHARAHGSGIEFDDFRRYQPGDDPRSIDWTVHARLRQLVVRVFRAEGHVRLHLLVDVSGSMTAGTPEKLACAKKIAAALCYIAVERRDAVGVATFDDTIRVHVPPAFGRPQLFRVFDALGPARGGGRSAIDRALIDYATAVRGPGLAVVLSDFFQADGSLECLRFLMYRGLSPALIQVVADEEIQPGIEDEAELVDIEDPSAPMLIVDSAAVKAYRERMTELSATLREFCLSHGLPWLQVRSSAPFDDLLKTCLQAGLLAAHM